MADFVLNAPLTNITDYQPAGITRLIGRLRSDTTGISCHASDEWCLAAHDADYGTTITAAATMASISGADGIFLGAAVRNGPNAGAFIGVWFNSWGNAQVLTMDPSGNENNISSNGSMPAGATAGDVYEVTVSIAAGTATITATQNGNNITFSANTTTNYANEASLAAAFGFYPQNSNGTKISKFEATGVSGGGGGSVIPAIVHHRRMQGIQ